MTESGAAEQVARTYLQGLVDAALDVEGSPGDTRAGLAAVSQLAEQACIGLAPWWSASQVSVWLAAALIRHRDIRLELLPSEEHAAVNETTDRVVEHVQGAIARLAQNPRFRELTRPPSLATRVVRWLQAPSLLDVERGWLVGGWALALAVFVALVWPSTLPLIGPDLPRLVEPTPGLTSAAAEARWDADPPPVNGANPTGPDRCSALDARRIDALTGDVRQRLGPGAVVATAQVVGGWRITVSQGGVALIIEPAVGAAPKAAGDGTCRLALVLRVRSGTVDAARAVTSALQSLTVP